MKIRIKTEKLDCVYLIIDFDSQCNDGEHSFCYSLKMQTPCQTNEGFKEAFPSGLDILEYIILNSPSRDLWDYIYKNNTGVDIYTGTKECEYHYFIGWPSLSKLLFKLKVIIVN